MQKGLDLLLKKYSVSAKAVLTEKGETVTVDGKNIPVLPWESDRRIIELRNLVVTGRLGNMCTYRIGHTAKKGSDLFALLAREIGILEFTVNSTVKEIFAIAGKNTMNCIAETENGCVCTIELGSTLDDGQRDIDKHEIITDNGVGCDRVVDTQMPQDSIYVFGKKEQAFMDTDAELYGYSEIEINTIRNAFAVAKNVDVQKSNANKWIHIQKVVAAAKASLETMENVKVEA
ncbi:MAG: hypothetical protein J6B72_05290 [Clostridia bacterium]|nr:hypothetical protein [Clostridia bacterium]